MKNDLCRPRINESPKRPSVETLCRHIATMIRDSLAFFIYRNFQLIKSTKKIRLFKETKGRNCYALRIFCCDFTYKEKCSKLIVPPQKKPKNFPSNWPIYDDTSGRATRFVSRSSIELWLLFGLVFVGVVTFAAFDKVVVGFANSTPSYWTPFNSIVTTNCCSPLAALPEINSIIQLNFVHSLLLFVSLTATSYFELHSGQYSRRCGR